jgi:hypothetical protein
MSIVDKELIFKVSSRFVGSVCTNQLLRRSQWREWKSMFIIIFVTFMQAYILV